MLTVYFSLFAWTGKKTKKTTLVLISLSEKISVLFSRSLAKVKKGRTDRRLRTPKRPDRLSFFFFSAIVVITVTLET